MWWNDIPEPPDLRCAGNSHAQLMGLDSLVDVIPNKIQEQILIKTTYQHELLTVWFIYRRTEGFSSSFQLTVEILALIVDLVLIFLDAKTCLHKVLVVCGRKRYFPNNFLKTFVLQSDNDIQYHYRLILIFHFFYLVEKIRKKKRILAVPYRYRYILWHSTWFMRTGEKWITTNIQDYIWRREEWGKYMMLSSLQMWVEKSNIIAII